MGNLLTLSFLVVAIGTLLVVIISRYSESSAPRVSNATVAAGVGYPVSPSGVETDNNGLDQRMQRQSSELHQARVAAEAAKSRNWTRGWEATCYDGQGGINGGHVTATGKKVKNGWTVAVDPSVIPMGSIIEVEFADGSTQYLQATDVGGAIKGKRLDIYNSNRDECIRFGIQKVKVRVIVRGWP